MRHLTCLLTLCSFSLCLTSHLSAKPPKVLIEKTTKKEVKEKKNPIFNQKMKSLAEKEIALEKYKGKVLLIVNTASKCGATPQYKNLQALHNKYSKKGLVILGFPCNQFGKQEPGTSSQIIQFCEKNYGVQFQMFAKIEVNGKKQAPLYEYLTSKEAFPKDSGKIRWNFEKFLISKKGKVVARFRTSINPESKKAVKAIEAELGK